jgi:aspartate 1-decarboxylase
MSYAIVDAKEAKNWRPRIIVLGEKNAIIDRRGIKDEL